MALNHISTATSSTPTLTKILRRDLKLANAQAKRQSLTTSTWYRPLHTITGSHSAYVNGVGGATLETLSGLAGTTVGHPWSTGTVTTYTMSIRSFNTETSTPGNIITTCNEGDFIWIEATGTNLTVLGGPDSYLQLGGVGITDQDIFAMGNTTDPIPWPMDLNAPYGGAPVQVLADNLTEGNEILTWNWYVNSATVASTSINIIDTSQTPGSLSVVNSGYLEVQGTTSDWALGTTWTMEWWSKADRASAENRLMAVFGQNLTQTSIDIFQQRGKLYLGKSSYTEIGPEPTPGVWTHVAIVSNAGTVTVYHNGTSVYGPTAVGYDLTNSTDKLYVGVRSQGNVSGPISQQAFSGQLTGIRITNTAVYSGTFDPLTVSLPPAKITGTKLLVNPKMGSASGIDLSDSAHTIVTSVSISEYYPPSVQLTTGTSLSLSGSNQDVQVTGTPTDWALGTTWTVEWWEKIPYGASGFFGVMSQDSNDGGNPPPYTGPLGFDIFHANGNIQLYNSRWSFTEPTQGVWNHIAIQNNNGTVTPYINGVATVIGQTNPALGLTNSSNDLVIGLRSPNGTSPGYSQWFNGQLANIRISNVARYSVKFTPPTTLVVDANVKLALSGQVGGSGMLDDVSASNHTITNNNAVVTSI